ncbi:DHH family phosphoesterase [Marispirochaeta sp.]|jgi:nanoRNase/pAp phosphatase (c-di-AMP/oligoRNAs hydrolase)|uniref:DHH family phosphoesterase n=1 Tax=Marispirochaeta sp. TaxID=2038653 RepID=UPI0029C7EDA2|nr:DHH family phosphoesterase [Marispirochaeta sp.]
MPNEKNSRNTAAVLARLADVLKGKEELLILLHTHPDPDAIASGAALQLLAKEEFDLRSSLAYSGIIARAENRAMVKKLGIHLKQYNRIKRSRYDCIALIDSQPGAGNNVLTARDRCDIVIDHHPRRKDTLGDLVLINPEIGATATILVELLREARVDIPADIATALAYAIDSETQTMHREAAAEDIQAYLNVYTQASIRKYGEIINPNLPHYYFLQLGRALNNALIYRNAIVTHLTNIYHPEIIAEMADFFLKHERISSVLCTGIFKETLIISIRTSSDKMNAGVLIKKLPLVKDNAGGHDRTAGGVLSLAGMSKSDINRAISSLVDSFARNLGHVDVRWKPLLDYSDFPA